MNVKRLSHGALWASTLLVLAFVSFPRWLPLVSASSSPATPVTVLKDTLTPLIDDFNRDADQPRVLALLSPT